jgi:hypothetical protein
MVFGRVGLGSRKINQSLRNTFASFSGGSQV